MAASGMMASRRLASEFANMTKAPTPGIVARPVSEANLREWAFWVGGPPDSLYEHAVFTGRLSFPTDYPLSPPKMVFDPPIFHPNVYGAAGARRGEVCISILHAGRDETGYERMEERWSPVQCINSILLSVLSMLAEPNVESPANVDAAKLFVSDRLAFAAVARGEVERSLALAGGAAGGGGGGRR